MYNCTGGIEIIWEEIPGAERYLVYRKEAGKTGWTLLDEDVITDFYLDKTAKDGCNYTYTVKAYGGKYYSKYDTKGLSLIRLTNPKTNVKKSSSGIAISWKKVTGAKGYYVYRKTLNGSYSRIATTNSLSYTDNKIKNGTTYMYAVRAYNGKSLSDYKARFFFPGPQVNLTNTSEGMEVSWGEVKGANRIQIYRKTGNGSYSLVFTSPLWMGARAFSWTDNTVKSGVTYTYAVRGFYGSDNGTFATSQGMYIANPVITVTNSTSGLNVCWNKVSGAKGYYIYRKTGSGSYSKLTTTTSLSYLDKSVKGGTEYTYAVRAYNDKTISSYTGVTCLRITNPKHFVYNTKQGPVVGWQKVSGASGYYVYRKTSSESYTKIATITGLSFTDQTAQKGITYTYAVRAYTDKYVSSYSSLPLKCAFKEDYEYGPDYSGESNDIQIKRYNGNASILVIPTSINGKRVTKIGEEAFSGNTSIKDVTMLSNIVRIGGNAFYDCPTLTKVVLSKGLTHTGVGTFGECSSLKSVTIPNGIKTIGSYTFEYCTSLNSINLPDSITSIDGSAFLGCQRLTSIKIPNSVTSIGFAAFSFCESLKTITLPERISVIEAQTFYLCKSLTSINIPYRVRRIGSFAFHGCNSLKTVNYAGTKGDWKYVNVEEYNEPLLNARLKTK